jgi:hypothetical protein
MKHIRRIIMGSTLGTALVVGGALLLLSPPAPAQTVPLNLPVVNTISVTGQQLISEKRITRTLSDFTYRLSVRNMGSALIVVSGRGTSGSALVTFTDNAVSFGDIAAATPANSTDTFTIRVDRTQPFNASSLTWQFTGAPGEGVPPDPGPANDLTVAGIDSNNNGVRDDVERILSQRFGGTPDYAHAIDWARIYQSKIVNPPQTRAAALVLISAGLCAAQQGSEQLQGYRMSNLILNTPAREAAASAFNRVYMGFGSEELSPCAQ